MYIFWKYITDAVCWYFCQAHFMLFVLTKRNFVNLNKGKITLIILPCGRVSLAMSWRRVWFILIENSGKQKK